MDYYRQHILSYRSEDMITFITIIEQDQSYQSMVNAYQNTDNNEVPFIRHSFLS
ncbi:hypothetical protein HQQ94_21760 [Shewanella sp. VB17]|uniref:hypothetical protein n=1 Tax=Shewanella sp. VB17 TaxID=2739432 RepID=UPI001566ABE7|nr:hypothetical protein [Shewanella sp. VB17]NRD75794.1 hypothetical protein [Shewanella sp. VB17]